MLFSLAILIVKSYLVVGVVDIAGCKAKVWSKKYCVSSNLKIVSSKLQYPVVKKIKKVLKPKNKQCPWYKKLVKKC